MNREEQLRLLEEIYGKVEEGKATVMSCSISSDFSAQTIYEVSIIDATAGVNYAAQSFTGKYYNLAKVTHQVAPLPKNYLHEIPVSENSVNDDSTDK